MSNSDILEGILKGDRKVVEKIYEKSFPPVLNLIIKNSGCQEDAEDIFQEALVVVYRKLKSNSLQLNCTFSTYLYSVCRNMWLGRLRRLGREIGIMGDAQNIVDYDSNTIDTINKNERYALYQKHFQTIGESCRKLLKLFFEGYSMRKITAEMGYGSDQYTRKRKFLCKEKLINGIKSDKVYSELSGNDVSLNAINQ